jgi:hypothetical protein
MEEHVYAPGDFSFIKTESEREMLADAYEAVTLEDQWDFMRTDPGKAGFVYSRDIKVVKIFMRMKIKNHNVQTLMIVMRNMAKIATEGWETYVDAWKQEGLEKEAKNSVDSVESGNYENTASATASDEAENSAEETKTPENSVEEESSPENSVINEHTGIAE